MVQALDLLGAWPRCTTEQFTGLMGSVTRHWARQVIQSLADLSLARDEHGRHVPTDEGLRHLARRDVFGCTYSSVALRMAEVVRRVPLMVVLYERRAEFATQGAAASRSDDKAE